MKTHEIVIFSCEYCGSEFKHEDQCKEHEAKCIFKYEDKDIQSAISKIRKFCSRRHCHNCKYKPDESNCVFTGLPYEWCK